MDLTKLLSLLETRKLFLARADQFEDSYEGWWPQSNVSLFRSAASCGKLSQGAVEQFLEDTQQHRETVFLSCWCAIEHESAAMWKLYLKSVEGIAICSDHDALATALSRSNLIARTTMVKYIDYDRELIPANNGFFPFVHKRRSFAHENELRVIVWSSEAGNREQIKKDATSVTIDVVPEELIKAIYVSPTAPKWFGQLVEQLLRRYGLSVPVERSGLYDRPSY